MLRFRTLCSEPDKLIVSALLEKLGFVRVKLKTKLVPGLLSSVKLLKSNIRSQVVELHNPFTDRFDPLLPKPKT